MVLDAHRSANPAKTQRILFLHDALRNGGAERQLALTVAGLPPQWQVAVWAARGGPFAEVIRQQGTPVFIASNEERMRILPLLSLTRLLLKWRPDVVHAWGAWSTLVAGLECRALGIPLIDCTVRSARGPDRRWLFRLNAGLARAVVSNSAIGHRAWQSPAAKSVVIRNGFDENRLPTPGQSPEPREPGVRIVMAARMTPGKDFAGLLMAARQIVHDCPFDAHFLLIGEGPDRRALMSEFADLIDAGKASFHSPGSEVMAHIVRCDIGVLLNDVAHHMEGCSNSILEYMAAGLPVICTDAGGNREVVSDSVTGFLVPPSDGGQVVAALLRLMEDDELRQMMGSAGRQRIHDMFSTEAMISSTVRLYESLTGSQSR